MPGDAAVDPAVAAVAENFEQTFSCPADRAQVKRRPDLDPVQFHLPMTTRPPAEVRNDPGRLAKWQADQDQELQRRRASYSQYVIVEATGCGHTQLQECRAHHAHGAVYPNVADCSTVTLPK